VSSVVAQLNEQSRAATDGHQSKLVQLSEQMGQFLTSMEKTVAGAQQTTNDQLQAMLSSLAEQSGGMVRQLEEQASDAASAHAQRQAEFAEQAHAVLSALTENMQTVSAGVRVAADTMRNAVVQLATTTKDSVTKMGQGAESLYASSSTLSRSLDGLRGTADTMSGTGDKLTGVANALTTATQSVQQVMGDYRATRESFAGIVADLRGTVENAKKEASLTSQVMTGIQTATEKLVAAEREAEDYLQGITQVLAEAHAAFSEQMKRTLREGNSQFHTELASATNLLKGAIQELGDTLDVAVTKG
jgi:ABC-type transporter Mla subunit MlaD